MMSAPSCSISRRVSLMAVSAWSLEQPMPTSLSGWPLIAPPVHPARGSSGFFGLAPANCDIAETTPARSWLSKEPNAPWQSDSTPILIGVPEPVRDGTAGWGAGQSLDAGCSLPPALTGVDDDLPLLPLLPLFLLLLPQPATTSAATQARTVLRHAPRRNPFIAGISLLEPSSIP